MASGNIISFVNMSQKMKVLVDSAMHHFNTPNSPYNIYGDNPGSAIYYITTSDNKIPYSNPNNPNEVYENSYEVARYLFEHVELGPDVDDYKVAFHFHFDKINHKVNVDVRYSNYVKVLCNELELGDWGEANNIRDKRMEEAIFAPDNGHVKMGKYEYGLRGSNSVFHRAHTIVTAANVTVKSLVKDGHMPKYFWLQKNDAGYREDWSIKYPAIIGGPFDGFIENSTLGLISTAVSISCSVFSPDTEKSKSISKSEKEMEKVQNSNMKPEGFFASVFKEMFPFGQGGTENEKSYYNSYASASIVFVLLDLKSLAKGVTNFAKSKKYKKIKKTAGSVGQTMEEFLGGTIKYKKDLKILDKNIIQKFESKLVGNIKDNYLALLNGIQSKVERIEFVKRVVHNPDLLDIFDGVEFEFMISDVRSYTNKITGKTKNLKIAKKVVIKGTDIEINLIKAFSCLPDPDVFPEFWKGKNAVEGFMEKFKNANGTAQFANNTMISEKVTFIASLSKFVKNPAEWAKKFGTDARHFDAWLGLPNTPGWARMNEDLLSKLVKDPSKLAKVNEFYKSGNPALPGGLLEDLRTGLKKLPLDVKKVINGKEYIVKYDKFGFPKFHVEKLVSDIKHIFTFEGSNKLLGNKTDFTKAKNKLTEFLNSNGGGYIMKYKNSWSKFYIIQDGMKKGPYTWHHMQDGKTMIPVVSDIHSAYKHTGGNRFLKRDNYDFTLLYNFFN